MAYLVAASLPAMYEPLWRQYLLVINLQFFNEVRLLLCLSEVKFLTCRCLFFHFLLFPAQTVVLYSANILFVFSFSLFPVILIFSRHSLKHLFSNISFEFRKQSEYFSCSEFVYLKLVVQEYVHIYMCTIYVFIYM